MRRILKINPACAVILLRLPPDRLARQFPPLVTAARMPANHPNPPRQLPNFRTIIVKIGSGVLTATSAQTGEQLSIAAVKALASDIAAVWESGRRVVIVSSGAVASGCSALGGRSKLKTMAAKQAAAAVGQSKLMAAWAKAFASRELEVAQILFTADDLASRDRSQNARRTLDALLAANIIPIINENDTVSCEEIKLGDNDHLSALTADLVGADALLMLSTASGLQDAQGTVIDSVDFTADVASLIRKDKSSAGTGGFATKLAAAKLAGSWGIHTFVAHGLTKGVVGRLLAGEKLGTHFQPASTRKRARQRFLTAAARSQGSLHVDAGAAKAVRGGASLLAKGLLRIEGTFDKGDVVDLIDPSGQAFARGHVSFSHRDVQPLIGQSTAKVRELHPDSPDEIIHRSACVLLS
jgi:glutamate 5-kinase